MVFPLSTRQEEYKVKKADFDFDSYKSKAQKYLNRGVFEGTPLTGDMFARAAEKTFKDTGKIIPLWLALSQAQFESSMGRKGRSPKNNPFNVGEFDDGTKMKFNSPEEGISAYYKLIANDYLKDKDPESLIENFVNHEGNRYASDPDYEKKIKSQSEFIKKFIGDLSRLNPFGATEAHASEVKNDLGIEFDKNFMENILGERKQSNITERPTAGKNRLNIQFDDNFKKNILGEDRMKSIKDDSSQEPKPHKTVLDYIGDKLSHIKPTDIVLNPVMGAANLTEKIMSDDPSIEKSFIQGVGEEATLGQENFQASGKESKEQFPAPYVAGKLAGGISSLVATGGILNALGYGRMAAKAGQVGASVWQSAPRYIPRALMTGGIFGTHAGMKETAKQVREKDINVEKIGEEVVKNFSLGATLGAIGGKTGYFKRAIAAGGLGYVATKSDGGSNNDALINGAIWAGFELIGGKGRDKQLREEALNNIRNTVRKAASKRWPSEGKAEVVRRADQAFENELKKAGGIEKVVESKANSLSFLEKVNQRLNQALKNVKPEPNVVTPQKKIGTDIKTEPVSEPTIVQSKTDIAKELDEKYDISVLNKDEFKEVVDRVANEPKLSLDVIAKEEGLSGKTTPEKPVEERSQEETEDVGLIEEAKKYGTVDQESKKQYFEMTREEFKNSPFMKYAEETRKGIKGDEAIALMQKMVDEGLANIEDANYVAQERGFEGGVIGQENLTTGKPIPSKPIEGSMAQGLSNIARWNTFMNVFDSGHRTSVINALQEGKKVPKSVLAEYIDWTDGKGNDTWASDALKKLYPGNNTELLIKKGLELSKAKSEYWKKELPIGMARRTVIEKEGIKTQSEFYDKLNEWITKKSESLKDDANRSFANQILKFKRDRKIDDKDFYEMAKGNKNPPSDIIDLKNKRDFIQEEVDKLSGKVPSGQIKPELQTPIKTELFQEKGELFEGKESTKDPIEVLEDGLSKVELEDLIYQFKDSLKGVSDSTRSFGGDVEGSFSEKKFIKWLESNKSTEGINDSEYLKLINKARDLMNPNNIKKKIEGYSGGSSSKSSKGIFTEEIPTEKAQFELKPIESIEMVRLAKELIGSYPKLKNYPKARGMFYPDPLDPKIGLNRELFVRGQEKQLAATLAHEIGHAIDWLPDKDLRRGNLLGRLFTLRKFMKSTFSGSTGESIDKNKLRRTALKGFLKDNNIDPNKWKADKKIREDMKGAWTEYYQKRVDNYAESMGYIQDNKIREEMAALSFEWRPIDPEIGKKDPYRSGSDEIYADFISAILNNPGYAEKKAPKAFKIFFENLDKKPDVKKEYFALQELLNGKPDEIVKARQEDIRRMFAKGEALREQMEAEKKLKKVNIYERIRQLLDDKNFPITDKVQKLNAKGVIPKEDVVFSLEEKELSDNDNYLMLGEVDEKVMKPVMEADMTIDDLGEYAFLKRVVGKDAERTPEERELLKKFFEEKDGITEFDDVELDKIRELVKDKSDREDLANPLGFAPKTAKTQLEALEKNLGPEKFAILEESAQKFHDIIFKSVEKAVEVGAYKKETFEKIIAPNKDLYVTFGVLNYLQDTVPSGIKAQRGTLSEIENPIITTALKTITLNRFIAHQEAKKTFVETWHKLFPQDIEPAKVRRIEGKPVSFIPKKEKGMIQLLDDGRPVAYYVDPYVAQSFEPQSPAIFTTAVMLNRMLGNKYFKNLVITYNLGFSLAFNPIRDFKRTYINLNALGHKITVGKLLSTYMKNLPRTIKRHQGINDDQIKEMMETKALDIPFIDYNFDLRNDSFGRTLKKFRLVGDAKPDPKNVREKAVMGLTRVLEAIRFMGSVTESLGKVAGYDYLKDKVSDDRQRAWITRDYIGTPNYRVKGQITDVTNQIFIFSNIMKEGLKSDLRLASNPKTRSGWWWSNFKVNIFPKVLMGLAQVGLAGKVLKDFYDKVSEYDKTNYIIVPLGVKEDGQAVYLRVPHDETSRLFSALAWKFITAPQNKDKVLTDVFAFGAGNMPGVAPAIEIADGWKNYLSGKNPYDSFRGRYVIPDRVFDAGGFPATKNMVKWSFNSAGFSQFTTYDDRRDSTFEAILKGTPGLNAVTRLLKWSDYGITEKMYDYNEDYRKESAKETIKRRDLFDKNFKDVKINDLPGLLDDASNVTDGKVSNVLREITSEVYGKDADKNDFNKVQKDFLKYVIKEENNPYARALTSAPSNEVKVKILNQAKEKMSEKEFRAFVWKLRKAKIISKNVMIDLGF